MKRERGKYNVLRSVKKEDGLPSLTISIEYLKYYTMLKDKPHFGFPLDFPHTNLDFLHTN